MKVEWSQDALADLDRFAIFLHDKHPALAPRVAQEVKAKAQFLADVPQSGRPLAGHEEYRQIVWRCSTRAMSSSIGMTVTGWCSSASSTGAKRASEFGWVSAEGA